MNKPVKASLIVLIALLLLSSMFISLVSADVLIASVNDEPLTGYTGQRKIVRLSNGSLCLVYFSVTQIYAKFSHDNGTTWSAPQQVSVGIDSTYYKYNPSVAVDSQDNIHVVWHGYSSSSPDYTQIWYNKFNGTAWGTPTLLSVGSEFTDHTQEFATIAVDQNDHLHVAWRGKTASIGTFQIYYTSFNGTAWSTPTRLSTASTMDLKTQNNPAIAVDLEGKVHVVWGGEVFGSNGYHFYHTMYNGESWTTPEAIDVGISHSAPQYDATIAIDTNNNIHVAWAGNAIDTQIIYAVYNSSSSSWASPIIISDSPELNGYPQRNPSIAVDGQGNVYVVWDGTSSSTSARCLWLATYDGSSWSAPLLLRQDSVALKQPNIRYSLFPAFNRLSDKLEFVYTYGSGVPYKIYFATWSLLPTTVCVELPQTVYSAKPFTLNITVNIPNGITYLQNCSVLISENFTIAWNQTNGFFEHYDPNDFCSLNSSSSSKTDINQTSCKLTFILAIKYPFPQGQTTATVKLYLGYAIEEYVFSFYFKHFFYTEALYEYNDQLRTSAYPYIVNTTHIINNLTFSEDKLNVTLSAPSNSFSLLTINTGTYSSPLYVEVNGVSYNFPQLSKSRLDSTAETAWFYDSETRCLYVKVLHESPANVTVYWALPSPMPKKKTEYEPLPEPTIPYDMVTLISVILFIFILVLLLWRKK